MQTKIKHATLNRQAENNNSMDMNEYVMYEISRKCDIIFLI